MDFCAGTWVRPRPPLRRNSKTMQVNRKHFDDNSFGLASLITEPINKKNAATLARCSKLISFTYCKQWPRFHCTLFHWYSSSTSAKFFVSLKSLQITTLSLHVVLLILELHLSKLFMCLNYSNGPSSKKWMLLRLHMIWFTKWTKYYHLHKLPDVKKLETTSIVWPHIRGIFFEVYVATFTYQSEKNTFTTTESFLYLRMKFHHLYFSKNWFRIYSFFL